MPLGQPPFKAYWKENMPFVIFIAAIFGTGVVFGAVLVSALTLDMNQELSRHLGNFFQSVDIGFGSDRSRIFWNIFGLNAKWILLIWLLGLSVVGLPIIFVMDFLKGALIGFTVSFLAAQYSWKGLLFSLVSVVPQNLVLIPLLIIGSVAGMSFSIYLVKNRVLQNKGQVLPPFVKYGLLMAVMLILAAGVSLFEAYVSPNLMGNVTPFLTLGVAD
ncbi:stage II sporulation protein M [Gorillibacterium massiliense]|uniref:stage II sporulation protein M n=1 Tax=Gorillibacterium massiliense TaxID=1280390 RepID=UPI0004AEB2E8|nr:stage II sporulation protein M [Gorillibacterium massiliense]